MHSHGLGFVFHGELSAGTATNVITYAEYTRNGARAGMLRYLSPYLCKYILPLCICYRYSHWYIETIHRVLWASFSALGTVRTVVLSPVRVRSPHDMYTEALLSWISIGMSHSMNQALAGTLPDTTPHQVPG